MILTPWWVQEVEAISSPGTKLGAGVWVKGWKADLALDSVVKFGGNSKQKQCKRHLGEEHITEGDTNTDAMWHWYHVTLMSYDISGKGLQGQRENTKDNLHLKIRVKEKKKMEEEEEQQQQQQQK